ncbi:MAG: PilN domain-containing protein [Pseudohaliea sp.]
MSSDQQWYLFGYDMRQLGRHWLAAWRDLFRGLDSPLRRHFDEVVLLEQAGELRAYQSGEPLPAGEAPDSSCRGVCLPADIVLHKRLTLPRAAESDLPTALAIEVAASSPFTPDDTAWGWRLAGRGEQSLAIDLAITARSAAMAFLGREYDSHDAAAQEVWAAVPDGMAVLAGFGEGRREALYRRRLGRVGIMAAACLLVLLALAGVYAGGKHLELARVAALAEERSRAAGDVTELREAIADANRQLLSAREIVARYPSPHRELARLTQLLGDDAWVAHFSADGGDLRIRGRAADAAAVMQTLSSDPAYAEVTAPQPISRVGNSGEEQFYLDLRVGEGAAP